MEEKKDLLEDSKDDSASVDYEDEIGTNADNRDQSFVNLMVKIIVNATIRECDEESNKVPTI